MPISHRIAIVYAPYTSAEWNLIRLNRMVILDCASGRHAESLVAEAPCPPGVAWTPDGSRLIVGRMTYGQAYGEPTVSVYDAVTLVAETGWPWPVDTPEVSRVAASNAHIAVRWANATLSVYAIATKSFVTGIPGISGYVEQMTWSPDGAYLAVCTSDALRVFESSSWERVWAAPTMTYKFPLAWSPDGAYLSIARDVGVDGTELRLYDVTTWAEIPTGVTSIERPSSIAWSADGSRIGIGLRGSPHLLVVSVPGFLPQPATLPADVRTGNNTCVVMLPDGRVVAARQSPRRVSMIARDLSTVEYDLHASDAQVQSISVSAWADNAISGFVRDESEAPAAGRRVIAIHDASAAVVGTATTAADGSYSMLSPHADGHIVVLVEDDGRAQALGSGILPL